MFLKRFFAKLTWWYANYIAMTIIDQPKTILDLKSHGIMITNLKDGWKNCPWIVPGSEIPHDFIISLRSSDICWPIIHYQLSCYQTCNVPYLLWSQKVVVQRSSSWFWKGEWTIKWAFFISSEHMYTIVDQFWK